MSMSGNPFSAASIGSNIASAIPGLAQGFFGNSGRPYQKASEAYLPYFFQAERQQNPFYQSGVNALPWFNSYLSRMQDPGGFINNLMGQYQESPWAKYQQQQAMRAGINAASMGGLPNGMGGAGIGSTPFLEQAQKNAANISSEDMSRWLQNVLGINSQLGQGYGQQIGYGQHAGDVLSQLAGNAGEYMGGTAYGQEAGQQQDRNSLFAGIAKLFGG